MEFCKLLILIDYQRIFNAGGGTRTLKELKAEQRYCFIKPTLVSLSSQWSSMGLGLSSDEKCAIWASWAHGD